ncbi:hypothetical protein H4582DRAFT_2082328 [Lactarius indigo]|nr:hypothetical protein H4582DRAFT_2082328 [Lactarius indigo]
MGLQCLLLAPGLCQSLEHPLLICQVSNDSPNICHVAELRALTINLSAAATTSQTEATTDYSGAMWPTDTDLLPLGANKLLLTNQYPLVCNVVQEAIEHLRVSLMFNHAFPTAPIAFAFTKESLITAAKKLKPGAVHIQHRLQQDKDYLAKVVPLLHNFNYIFPTKRGLLVGTPPRTHPYCNECIISVIWDLFFTGGKSSFASHFEHLFPVHQGHDGILAHEVPVPMVALVATAWRTGAPQVFEFSANTYLDVYRCNAGTLNYILNSRPNAYHVMMANIYTQASSNTRHDDSPDVEIADLDLNDLED